MKNEKKLYEWLTNLIDTEEIVFKNKLFKNIFNNDIEFDIEFNIDFYIENLELSLNSNDYSITICKRENDLFTNFENKFDLELEYNFNDENLFKKLFTKVNNLHHTKEIAKNNNSLDKFIDKISEPASENDLEKEWKIINEMSIRSEIASKLMQLQYPSDKPYLDKDFIIKNILKISDEEIKNDDNIFSVIKVDRKYSDYMNKFDNIEYLGDSRFDDLLMYKINIPIIEVIKKIYLE